MGKVFRSCFYSFVLLQIFAGSSFADGSLLRINSILDSHCIKCHGEGGKVKGKVNLKELQSANLLSSKPELLESLIGVIRTVKCRQRMSHLFLILSEENC